MYYGVLTLCAIMFGSQFLFTKMYKDAYGNDLKAMCVSAAGGSLLGIIILAIINGFSLTCTPFSLIMAIINTVNGNLFLFCSLKSLGKINLSLYSVFSMIGGMALPFITGILFYNEPLTTGKVVCFLFITLAILLTFEKGEKAKGGIYYIGIFVFNGMSGVISKLYTDMPFEKVPAAEYSILCAVVNLIVSLIILIFLRKIKRPLNSKAVISIIGNGVFGRVANYLLLICLLYLPASAQYPFITGGTMVVSTVLSCIINQKPSKKEVLSVILSMTGLISLVIIK